MALAEKVGQFAEPGDILTLEGDLGAGKTCFTKGLAKGLGIKRTVKSPTFTIIKEYNGRIPLYHMDVYRVEDSAEELGLEEYFYGTGITVVEWASLIEEQLPEERLAIAIYHKGGDKRELRFIAKGHRYEQLSKEIATWARR